MIPGDRRDHAGQRLGDDIRRVEPAAQPHLQQQHVRRGVREQQEGRGRRGFEDGETVAAGRSFHRIERGDQRRRLDQPPRQTDAFAKIDEMGRGVDMHAPARGLEDRAQEGDHRALAVGARDMDGGRQAVLGIAEPRQHPADAIESEIDRPGMTALQLGKTGGKLRVHERAVTRPGPIPQDRRAAFRSPTLTPPVGPARVRAVPSVEGGMERGAEHESCAPGGS